MKLYESGNIEIDYVREKFVYLFNEYVCISLGPKKPSLGKNIGKVIKDN